MAANTLVWFALEMVMASLAGLPAAMTTDLPSILFLSHLSAQAAAASLRGSDAACIDEPSACASVQPMLCRLVAESAGFEGVPIYDLSGPGGAWVQQGLDPQHLAPGSTPLAWAGLEPRTEGKTLTVIWPERPLPLVSVSHPEPPNAAPAAGIETDSDQAWRCTPCCLANMHATSVLE
jgi:hypothetical protein